MTLPVWSVPDALAMTWRMLNDEVLNPAVVMRALDRLVDEGEALLVEHLEREKEIDTYLQHLLFAGGPRADFVAQALSDAYTADLLEHIALRWWLARDALAGCDGSLGIPGAAWVDGRHDVLDALSRLLYCGRDVLCKAAVPLPGTPGPLEGSERVRRPRRATPAGTLARR